MIDEIWTVILNHWGLMDENGCGLADTVLLETE
jgi:hypothetical protein